MDRRHFLASVAATTLVGGDVVPAASSALSGGWVDHGQAIGRGAVVADPADATVLWRRDTDQPVVALTFDDGPDPRYTPGVLALLEDHGATATFYMQGRHVEEHPDLARAVAERHAVGNHSFNHPDLGAADDTLARRELHDTHEVIRSVVGRVPDTFRPPYGGLSGATLLVAADMGYDVILWSDRIASRSTVDHNLRSARELRPGAVVVAHDGGRLPNQTVLDSLPGVLETISRRGLHLVTVADLLRL